MSDQPDSNHRINPRYRAYGRARLEIAQRARTRQDWDKLWKRPQYSFPFVWGHHWKQCIEYRVDDFAAEVGFLIDVLGLPVNAFNPEFAMFTGLNREFYFAVTPAPPGGLSTPPDAIRIQFMVDDIFATTEELQRRGVIFDTEPQAVTEGSLQWIASFRTPHGICMELWGMVELEEEDPALRSAVEPPLDTRLPIAQFLEEAEPEDETDQLDELEDDYEDAPDEAEEDDEDIDLDTASRPSHAPAAHPQASRANTPPSSPPHLFKNSQEILEHLQKKPLKSTARQGAPGKPAQRSEPAPIPPVFRPAPKPNGNKARPDDDFFSDPGEGDSRAHPEYHYKPIPFNKD